MKNVYVRKRNHRFKSKVRDRLVKAGFTVFRCAGSKPIDLVAVSKNSNGKPIVLLIECKKSCILPETDRKKLIYLAKETGGIPIFAYPEDNTIILYDLIDNKFWRKSK